MIGDGEETAQIADVLQLQDELNDPIRIRDTNETTAFLNLTTTFAGGSDRPKFSSEDNLYELRKICLCFARRRL